MRRLTTLLIGMSIMALGMYGEDVVGVGTWQYNPAKSTGIDWGVKSQTDVRVATPDGGAHVTRTVERADGSTLHYSFAYKFDGKENRVTGNNPAWDTISVKRVDAHTDSWEVKKSGAGEKYHTAGTDTLSKDGKTLIMAGTGTDADGKPRNWKMVFDKQ